MLPGQFEIQKSILEFREAGFTYQQIRQVFPALTGDAKITTCLVRTALGLPWCPGYKGGTDPYLCDADEQQLADYCLQARIIGIPESSI